MELQEIRRAYDEFAGRYDLGDAIPEALGLRRLRRELLSRAHGRVLEVAIGTGRNVPLYPEAVRELVGVDISTGMMRRARKRMEDAGWSAGGDGKRDAGDRASDLAAGARPSGLALMDGHTLAFGDGTFDTVVETLTLCTFTNPVAALRELARVCRPGGRVLLLEHGRSSAGLLARYQDWRAEAHARMAGCHWNREPLELVREAGLRITSARRTFFGVFHPMEARPL